LKGHRAEPGDDAGQGARALGDSRAARSAVAADRYRLVPPRFLRLYVGSGRRFDRPRQVGITPAASAAVMLSSTCAVPLEEQYLRKRRARSRWGRRSRWARGSNTAAPRSR
jgi:hypothetical protein